MKNFNKGKNHNKGSKFVGSNKTQDNFIIVNEADYIEDEDYDERGDDYGYPDDSMAMIPVFMAQALDVTKLIIENKVRNSEKISDKDIYRMHRDSFMHLMSIFDHKNENS